jgi:hypothetical protein
MKRKKTKKKAKKKNSKGIKNEKKNWKKKRQLSLWTADCTVQSKTGSTR